MTTVDLTRTAASAVKADAVVVGIAKAASGPVLLGAPDVDKAFKGRLAATLASLGATGKADEVTRLPGNGAVKAPVVLAVGVGDLSTNASPGRGASSRSDGGFPPYDGEQLRRAAGAAARALAGTTRVALALPTPDPAAVEAVATGALLGAYSFRTYRVSSLGDHKAPVETFVLVSDLARDRAAKSAASRAATLSTAVIFARDLVNTPARDLHPESFADAAVAAAARAGLDVEVMDEKALAAGGFDGIVGVGQGSARPPRLVRLSYRHKKATKTLALVGKGITFDSGGLSLKPSQAMEWMKADMGGAAAVVAAMTAIAELGPAIDVDGWVPMAENMPSGTAQRPSDVITAYGGRTVEVLNTDAEGRLILADAIVRASQDSPDLIVDTATLTGAAVVALGSRVAGIMSNDDAVRDGVHDAARRAGEAMWPMPLPPELRKSMDSEVADIANVGDKYGGMLVAGLFLQEFVGEGLRWAHLDIAGPAFNNGDAFGYTPKGGTGAAVRTLVRIAEDLAEGRL